MWLSPLKGDHLTLRQLDKTLPVDIETAATQADNMKIERGSFVYISTGASATGTPKFALYKDAQAQLANAVPYIALMGVKDFQAGMAGNVGQAPEAAGIDYEGTKATGDNASFLNPTQIEGAQPFLGPKITAISVLQPAEWQTSAYDKTQAVANYYVGAPLTINDNGVLTPWTTGHNVVGYVTAAPAKRWVNDLGASVDGARISGGRTDVIAFSTAWIPAAATSFNPLASGKPKVAAAAAKPDQAPAAAPAAPAAAAGAAANKPAQAK